MQLPLNLDTSAGKSLQLQIFDQLRSMIVDGRLRPGARMPASRVFASDLRVSRNTVVLAYDRLAAEGFLEMRSPIGAFVASNVIRDGPAPVGMQVADDTAIPERRQQRLVFRGRPHTVVPNHDTSVRYDFWVGRSDPRLFPGKPWEQTLHKILRQRYSGMSGYCNPAGLRELRGAIAEHVGVARGIRTHPEQIVVTSGIQQGLSILSRLFIRSGTEVAIENPGYRGAANLFASYGAQLRAIDVDDAGVDTSRLPRDAAFIYLTPSHQFPTGATLPLERREQLLEWSRRTQAYVVEDDYDSDFSYDRAPLPALKSLDDDGQVIYLGTFSKSLAAAMRIGYMVLPRNLVEPATAVKALFDNCSPWLPQKLLADFVGSGAFAHHLRRVRTIYRRRRDRLLQALGEHFGDVDIRGTQGGMHVLWRLPGDFPGVAEIERDARRHGVGIYGIQSCNVFLADASSRQAHSLVLGYASLDEEEIAHGIARLAAVISGDITPRAQPAATRTARLQPQAFPD